MKKTLVSLLSILALSSLFTLTSCKKEATGNGSQFRAAMENCTDRDGKTVLNGFSLNWVAGDQVAVYGTAGCGIYSATPQNPAMPIRFFSGEDDPCALSRQKFVEAMRLMTSIGYTNVRCRLYKGMRHDILHEKNKLRVYSDILRFIETGSIAEASDRDSSQI